ncbi:DEAD/DEAH box helicase [Pseudoalteromonas piratica]|uniref:DEAD-box ATP-dependent RNA helicase RhpA n=1 Tax=Pseudoalteromonas piratica TaxID=1348114 RepID=A0A0A7EKY2_9GAMM|nr:DEAD/DEAH box helicase [Pseudoalteromonas piratica]AIY66726.1 ATP-dependent RNA helicase RhlE [Pseudoalteromonas piratica]
MSFNNLGLTNALLTAITEQGYKDPSAIQREAIPAILAHKDVMAIAQTGTGKTAGFSLPVLQLLADQQVTQAKHIRALIITPTRELAAQVATSINTYAAHLNVSSLAVFGGVRIEPQITALENGVDVLIATPGRLMDLYQQGAVHFEQLTLLVLDEADRMLDLGFIDDIKKISALLPTKRQTLMFSATFTNQIKALAETMLINPVLIEVEAANSTVDNIKQTLYHVDKHQKTDVLIHLLKKKKWPQVLVFSRTKQGAEALVNSLKNAGISADSIHANRTQHARTIALAEFKNETINVLVATDIAARGIDINQLPCVINFDLPYVAEDYVHRIGRTGRAGKKGHAISLFSDDEVKQLNAIERLINRTFSRDVVAGFVPSRQRAEQMWGGAKDNSPTKSKKGNKKASKHQFDDDEYGNFEPMPDSSNKKKSNKRKRR